MTSQISTAKLLKQELKQSTWMHAFSWLGHLITGPVFLLLFATDYDTYRTDLKLQRYLEYPGSQFFIAMLFMMILAISFCIGTHRYLFSKRMVDLYHSAPISRSKIFKVKYIHGLLVWFVPFICNTLSVYLLTLIRVNSHLTWAYTGKLTLEMLQAVVLLIFCFFIFYHLFLVAVYLSGNILNLFTNVALMGFPIICISYLLIAYSEQFLDTYCSPNVPKLWDVLFALSPFVSPFVIYSYQDTYGFRAFLTEHYTFLLSCLAVLLVMLYIAIRLYKNRPSELAERGTTHKYYALPAKIAVTVTVSMFSAIFFGELMFGDTHIGWGIFGAILGGILCHGAISSIQHTTIKAFFKHKISMVVITLSSILLLFAFYYDWFGYDAYLPAKEEIAGVTVYNSNLSDNAYRIVVDDELGFRYVDNDYVYQNEPLTDKDICYDFLSLVTSPTYSQEDYTWVYAKVDLENGRSYYRNYRLSASDYRVLAPFVETEEYKNSNYKINSGLLGYPYSIEIYNNGFMDAKMIDENIPSFMDAYWADFEEHYNLEELSSYFSVLTAEIRYVNTEGRNIYYPIHIPVTYTRTMDYLQELYPDSIPLNYTPENIYSITPYLYQERVNEYGGYYGYFGLEDSAGNDSATDTSTEQIEIAQNSEMCTVQEVYRESITDRETIEALHPYLYYGDYISEFSQREYIYVGEVQTTSGHYTQCYVKPNTLPKECIDIIINR